MKTLGINEKSWKNQEGIVTKVPVSELPIALRVPNMIS